jgi:hypothetical protein
MESYATAIAAVEPHQLNPQHAVAAVILRPLLSRLGENDAGSAVTLNILKPMKSIRMLRCSILLLLLC